MSGPAQSGLDGKRILLVDDNRVHREIASEVLRRLGCVVVSALNGQEALVHLESGPFFLVLMDIDMPWMDGIKAATLIRERVAKGKLHATPILAITADHTEETARKCLEAGMEDVIPKHIWQPRWEPIMIQKLSRWM